MLRQVIEEALNNKRFTETVMRVIETRGEIAKAVRRRVEEVLKAMSIPSCHEINAYRKRVERLEDQIDWIGRRIRNQAGKLEPVAQGKRRDGPKIFKTTRQDRGVLKVHYKSRRNPARKKSKRR